MVQPNSAPTYVCERCPTKPKFLTLGESALHQKKHGLEKNFVFKCYSPSCGLTFLTYTALETHTSRFHRVGLHVPHHSLHLTCTVLDCHLSFPSFKLLCHHLMNFHQKQQHERVQCPFKDVCKSQNLFLLPSFRTHLSQKHKGWNRTSNPEPNQTWATSEAGNVNVNIGDVDMDMDVDVDVDENYCGEASATQDLEPDRISTSEQSLEEESRKNLVFEMKKEFRRNLAMFYLRLEAQHNVPVSTLEVIAEGLAELATASQFIVKKVVESQLDDLKVKDVDQRETVCNTILLSDCMYAYHLKDSRFSLRTNARRKTYYKQNFMYIEPVEINLSKDVNDPSYIYLVSPRETLEVLLSQPLFRNEVKASFSRSGGGGGGLLKDYNDGSLYKERQAAIGEKTIDILIFQDSFTGTRDLSSAADHNDVLGMYMTLGNLKRHLRSKIGCMQLLMLIPGFKRIFKLFKVKCFDVIMKAFKRLERDGIDFEGESVKVKLQFIQGDNKGQHEIGGFIQCFSSEFFCRFCPMRRAEIRENPWVVAPLRTREDYEEAIKSVPNNRKSFMGVSGHDFSCPFNKLENFHVCDPSLPPCIAHDIFEGVLNYDLVPILTHFKEKKWLSYEVLNRRISKFGYLDSDSRNRPAQLKFPRKKSNSESEPKLGGHAVQNWTLLRLLPFLLDDMVKDTNDEYWKLYLALKKIVEYVCAPDISLEQLSYLKLLIEDYSVQRSELLGDGKPKHHFINHYPDLIEIMGPIYHLQTLRFESFHQFFKNILRSGRNFINIGMSMINKYCLYVAYSSAGVPFSVGVKVLEDGLDIPTFIAANPDSDNVTSALHAKNIGENALLMNSIVVDDILIKKGKWLLMGNGDDEVIIVGKVKYAVLDGCDVSLLLEKHEAIPLQDLGLYSVQVERLPKIFCVSFKDLSYPCSHSMYAWGDHPICFSLRHTLAHKAPF